jgi:rhodanese-related sulfurtransferase
VLGVLPGVIGSLQATEAIKLLADIGEPPIGKLLHYDALASQFRTFNLRPDPQCAVCGENPTITSPQPLPGYDTTNCTNTMNSIDVLSLKAKLDSGDAPHILDVREPDERAICKIDGTLTIPLGELADRIGELPTDGTLYVHCKAGGRSAKAVTLLEANGFENAINIDGGIDAWRTEVDPTMPGA